MTLKLRKNTPSSNGILTEVQNTVGGVLHPLTNEQVDSNFSLLNVAVKVEETRALAAEEVERLRAIAAEATKVNLLGGNTITGAQNLTGAAVTLLTSAPLSDNAIASTNAYVDGAVLVEKTRAIAAEATKVNLLGGNTITGAQNLTGAAVTLLTSTPLSDNAIASTNAYVDGAVLVEKTRAVAAEATKVNLSGGNTISGSQVFTGPSVIVPTPDLVNLSSNPATTNWVSNYLGSIYWDRTISQTSQNTYIAPASNYIKFPNPDIFGVKPKYLGVDLGTPARRFANVYAGRLVAARGTLELGDAELKGSTEGGVVLPTNTAIGSENNVIPANLASSILDYRFSKTGKVTPSKIELTLDGSNIVSSPTPVGLLPDGSITPINLANTSSNLINTDEFIGFANASSAGTATDVTVSGKVTGFTNLDYGLPLTTKTTVTPNLGSNDAITVSDGIDVITVSAPGIGSEWLTATAIKNAIQLAAPVDFDFTFESTDTVLTFTATGPGAIPIPTYAQTTQSITERQATFTIALTDAEVNAFTDPITISDGTNSVTMSDFTEVSTVATFLSILSFLTPTPGVLVFAITQTATGLLFTYSNSAPITVVPTMTGLTVEVGVTGVTGVPASVAIPTMTTITTGREAGTLVEYFINNDGSLTPVSSSTNIKIGTAISATELFLYTTSTIDTYVSNFQNIKLTNLSVATNEAPSGEGSLNYSNTTGVFTFTPPKAIVDAALTGIPTAPTAAAATDTTQIASTAFVKTAIDNLIANSPAALDTLNELALAINNDASFATTLLNTINTGLSLKAPLANPVFTGTATIPTPANSTNDNTIATTAFVKNTTPPLENAALTGIPTAPTAAPSINTTQIASTEYVTIAVAQGGGGVNIDGGTATSIRNTTTITLDGGGAT